MNRFFSKILFFPELIRCLFLGLVDYLVTLPITRHRTNRLLIVRLDNIGDFVLWIPWANALKKLYPGRHITLIGNRTWTELAQKIDCFHQVWELDRKKFSRNIVYRASFLRKVKKIGFQTVVQPRNSREILFEDAIVKASCALKKIGARGDYSNIIPMLKVFSDRAYTRLIDSEKSPTNEQERNAHFINQLGKTGFNLQRTILPTMTDEKRLLPKQPYVILFPGASHDYKMWPVSSFARFAEIFKNDKNVTFIACGGPNESERANQLIKRCRQKGIPIDNLTGKTSLLELVEVIRNASLLVSNDTSAIHIAAAVSTPSICILGGGHFGRFLPYPNSQDVNMIVPIPVYHRMPCYGCNWICKFYVKKGSPVPCIENITVTQVVSAAKCLHDKMD